MKIKFQKKIKITLLILSILIILLISIIIFIIIYFTINNKNGSKNEKGKQKSKEEYLLEINGFKEECYDIYGNRTINISYLENNIIPNTFKNNSANCIEELGDLNEGKDYTKPDVNVYIYIFQIPL